MTSLWLFGGLVAVCCVLSFFFSGMEAGVFALNRLRIRQQMRAGRHRATVLHGFLDHSENFLWTIFVGNTLVNFIAVTVVIAGLYQSEWLEARPLWLWLTFAALVFLFYALGDLLPKMLFRLYPTRLCMAVALPFRAIHFALSPLVQLMEWLARGLLRWTGGRRFTGNLFGSRDEFLHTLHESGQILTTEERQMINRVLDLQNWKVGQVAVPLAKVVSATTRTPAVELVKLCRERQLTHVPIWREEEKPRRIVGLVNVQRLLYADAVPADKTAAEFLKPGLYLDESLRLEDALRLMQRGGHRLAVVLGADGREAGIVSLEDILRVIFGEVNL
ncbi:MAG: DUF21 domain-containing protein [Verrucomicrobia bacterium]|nr:DUF21 domain-containing protein [Verrucomicrobiota bacterium]